MVRVRVSIEFQGPDERPVGFERTVEVARTTAQQGQQRFANELLASAEADIFWYEHWVNLPNVEGLVKDLRQTFRLEDLGSGMYDERRTVQWIWLEIANLLHQAKVLLARARAFKGVEARHAAGEDENTLSNIHFTKLEIFNLAVIYLAKVHDLILRLIFESFGGTLVQVERRHLEWERDLTWKNVKEGLKERESNPRLREISDEEYHKLRDILAGLRGSHVYRTFIRYRNAVAHKAQPSVDYVRFHNAPEAGEWKIKTDEHGREVSRSRGFGGGPAKPDYTFEELYATAATTLSHWVRLLGRLQKMPRFGPQAMR